MKRIIDLILGLPLLIIVYAYRYLISPFTPPSCRHTPTCSEYMIDAVKEWGPLTGSWMGLRRLSKCHPWGTHGYDPVPKNPKKHTKE
ncbi:MAG: membrane protein insertion efficiency factor YidD [Bacteroidota bacterium]|nr:membrane protein insertion efficiency factor YidD [Bacteroidota bacterium]MDX5427451.1 membrane protein insertion efficiency factor YidD [Bacteroidota bacterium]MDX5448230.1 membrane protein insertion efficiency factor YidD [Bacteroidota bacterium]MDX5505389.1 membrane protein insertion efficiency factor YidD [Bacteroidota bacterium]